jgi:hypothetical protein
MAIDANGHNAAELQEENTLNEPMLKVNIYSLEADQRFFHIILPIVMKESMMPSEVSSGPHLLSQCRSH